MATQPRFTCQNDNLIAKANPTTARNMAEKKQTLIDPLNFVVMGMAKTR